MDEKFIEMVRKELGESINPAYVEKILSQNITELLVWMHGNLKDTEPTVMETAHHSQYSAENEHDKSVLMLGLRILESHFSFIQFVLKEIRSRAEATNIPPRESPKLII